MTPGIQPPEILDKILSLKSYIFEIIPSRKTYLSVLVYAQMTGKRYPKSNLWKKKLKYVRTNNAKFTIKITQKL